MSDGKRTRTEIQNLTSIDEFARHVSFQSNFRPIVRLIKFWAQPLTKKDPTWGASLKIIKAEYEPYTKSSTAFKDYMNSDAFLDSDDDKPSAAAGLQDSAPIAVATSRTVAQVESSDDDTPKPAAKVIKKVAQVESSDDDDSKPAAKVSDSKVVAKKVAQVESSDDDDSKPAAKVSDSKVVAKKVAQVESSDDSDDDAKPVVKAATTKKVAQVESSDSEEDAKPAPKKAPAKATRGGKGGKQAHA
jgi:hypothetical protein